MPRIETWNESARWRYKCPECQSVHWRVHDGTFGCRRCGVTIGALLDGKTGEEIPREAFEFVGPEAAEKAAYDSRTDD